MALRQAKHPTKKGPKAEKFRARPDEVMTSCPGAARRILQSTGKKIRTEILNQVKELMARRKGFEPLTPDSKSGVRAHQQNEILHHAL